MIVPTMHHLVYVSSAREKFTKEELVELLEQARRNNAALGVTGLLLYKDGNFMQVLEGDRDVVNTLYRKITLDPRHKGALKLLDEPVPARGFPDWSMAFRDLKSPELLSLPGFSEFLNETLAPESLAGEPRRAEKLLNMFRAKM
jgi:hypothetical protein